MLHGPLRNKSSECLDSLLRPNQSTADHLSSQTLTAAAASPLLMGVLMENEGSQLRSVIFRSIFLFSPFGAHPFS